MLTQKKKIKILKHVLLCLASVAAFVIPFLSAQQPSVVLAQNECTGGFVPVNQDECGACVAQGGVYSPIGNGTEGWTCTTCDAETNTCITKNAATGEPMPSLDFDSACAALGGSGSTVTGGDQESGDSEVTCNVNGTPVVITPGAGQSLDEDATQIAGDFEADCTDPNVTQGTCGIITYLVDFIRILTAVFGVVVVIMITVTGIQYSAARDNPQATAAAKAKLLNIVLALLAYLFLFAFLQYIIPGGVV